MENKVAVINDVPDELVRATEGWADRANAMRVADAEGLEAANTFLAALKRTRELVDGYFDPEIKAAYALHRALVAKKRTFTDQLDDGEAIIKRKLAAYLAEQEAAAQAAAREAFLAKQRAAAAASVAHVEAVQAVRAGELERAEELEAKARAEAEREAAAAAEMAAARPPQAPGLVLKSVWSFEIEDESLIPRQFLRPDEKKIRAYVLAMREQASIPGVRIFQTATVAATVKKG